jgi:hypothetical protein
MTDSAGPRTPRYGVFLLPDPRTAAAVTTITTQIKAQYGLVSAAAFPPHVTLVGSLALAGDPDRALPDLESELGGVLAARKSFLVANAGVARLGNAIVYDVHERDGAPNSDLLDLVAVVRSAVLPRLAPTGAGALAADVREPGQWHGHLSLASHEMDERPELADEVVTYIEGLEVTPPNQFGAEVVALYRFEHPTWTGRWWTDLSWSHLRSWRLPRGSELSSAASRVAPS